MVQSHFQRFYEDFKKNWARLGGYRARKNVSDRVERIVENVRQQMLTFLEYRVLRRTKYIKLLG